MIRIFSRERGASDTGVVFALLGLGILLSIGLGIMGWVKSVKDERIAVPVEKNKPVTDPYHEPGAFQITF